MCLWRRPSSSRLLGLFEKSLYFRAKQIVIVLSKEGSPCTNLLTYKLTEISGSWGDEIDRERGTVKAITH